MMSKSELQQFHASLVLYENNYASEEEKQATGLLRRKVSALISRPDSAQRSETDPFTRPHR